MPSAGPTAGVSKPKVIAEGLCFPVTGTDKSGDAERSTQVTGKAIIGAAISAADEGAGRACVDEPKWRFKYNKHFVKMVEVSAKSPEAAIKVAQAGLDYMYDNFEFLRDGKTHKLRAAMDGMFKGSYATGFIEGSKPRPSKLELEVPYKGTVLKGDALLAQLEAWVRYGTIEPSAGSAIAQVAQSSWLDLGASDRYFVLLGAGAAMGPLQTLLSLGANVIAIDVPQSVVPNIWKRIIATAKDSCGTLTFPLAPGTSQRGLSDDELCDKAGCDLFKQTPEVKNWLLEQYPGKPLCVGGYAYIPGEQFPRVSLAMDTIIKYLTEKRQAAVAFLCTPTDCHLVPQTAHMAAKKNFNGAPIWQKAFGLTSGKFMKPNFKKVQTDAGETLYFVDDLIVAQGPNYALAKRIQHWRCMVARSQGCVISSNIAPSTSTRSVTQNKMFAYAYEMMPLFKPYEIPGPETSNAVMTALLIHDLHEPMHAGSPRFPLTNPQQIFSQGGFHGGMWRCGFTLESISVPAVLLYYVNHFLVRTYLVLYNLAQTIGWCLVFSLYVRHVLSPEPGQTPWGAWGESLTYWQTLASLEVAHAMLGMVKASPVTTGMQVASRVIVVQVLDKLPATRASNGLYAFTFAWCITEIIRYSWYFLNLIGKPPKFHTWLRYSTFTVLYPIGILGENIFWWDAIEPCMGTPALFTIALGTLIKKVIMPAYLPGGPVLYMHMLAQRKKTLAGLKAKNKGV